MDDILNPIPADLKEILDAPVANTEEAATRAIGVYREAKAKADAAAWPWLEVAAAAKQMMTEIITETGRMSWKTTSGSAYIPAAGVTVTYDAKALDALCASSPELAAILHPHRMEKERPGSLTIRA